MKLPEKIQRERKKMGLSQEKLAEKIGVSRQAITKWENGESLTDVILKEKTEKAKGDSS